MALGAAGKPSVCLASDQGAGIKSTRITVNGIQAAGEDLGTSCHPLPGGLTSSLSPCPKGIGKSYSPRHVRAAIQARKQQG